MSGFACMECGHKFKTIKAAEKASFGDAGCPKCGGSDIDLRAERTPVNVKPTTVEDVFKTADAQGFSAAWSAQLKNGGV